MSAGWGSTFPAESSHAMRRYSPRVEGLRLARTIAWRGRVTLLTGSSRSSSRPQQERGRTRGQSWQQAVAGRLEGTRQAKATAIEENTEARPTATRRQQATVTHPRTWAEPRASKNTGLHSWSVVPGLPGVVVGRSDAGPRTRALSAALALKATPHNDHDLTVQPDDGTERRQL